LNQDIKWLGHQKMEIDHMAWNIPSHKVYRIMPKQSSSVNPHKDEKKMKW
jgi:hypothetical protein